MSGLHIFSFLCMYMQIVASVCLCVCVCVRGCVHLHSNIYVYQDIKIYTFSFVTWPCSHFLVVIAFYLSVCVCACVCVSVFLHGCVYVCVVCMCETSPIDLITESSAEMIVRIPLLSLRIHASLSRSPW